MTIAAEVETSIRRPPGRVFEALTAVERFPDWLIASGIVKVERLDAGLLVAGSLVRIEQRIGGRASTLDGSITMLDPARSFGLRCRDRAGVTIEIDAALTPDGPGTRLRWSLRIDLPLRFRMFETVVAPQARRAATLDLEAFKRRLEATTDA